MKIIAQKIYLTMSQMVECGFKAKTIIDAKSLGSKCWEIINDPDDKRKLLIGFDGLTPDRRRLVELRFGNPWDYMATQPILDMVVNDWRANEYYRAYRYASVEGEMKMLPIDRVNQYTRAASWLQVINGIGSDNYRIKRELKISVEQFKANVTKLVALEKERGKLEGYAGLDVLAGNFPSSHQRLWATAKEYKTEGFDYLIDARFGNKFSAKLGKVAATDIPITPLQGGITPSLAVSETAIAQKSGVKGGGFDKEVYDMQMAVIRYCCGLHNNLDAAQVKRSVDIVFEQKGWKTVGRAVIARFIKENRELLTPGRHGKRNWMNSVAMQVKRKAPKSPMLFWTLDGWTVELMYRERTKEGWAYNRLVAVIVIDPFNKYPIGYAIGERETPELIKEAMRNAIQHSYELFGKPYHPIQLQSDNYQIKNLTPFYQATTQIFTPAAVGNSKAKTIEPYFMYLNKQYCQMSRNWTGYNVDASKEKQVNREFVNMIKNQFPDRAGVESQIKEIIKQERLKKIGAVKEGWANLPETDRRELPVTDWLYIMGEVIGDRTNKVTGAGLIKEIDGVKYYYDSFDPEWRANMHLDWTIYGEYLDLRKVLAVSADGKKKFVLEQKRELPMDLHSSTPEDHAYRARITQFNKTRVKEITEQYAHDAEVVEGVVHDLGIMSPEQEFGIKLMLTHKGQQKEGIQDAKRLGTNHPGLATTPPKNRMGVATPMEIGSGRNIPLTPLEGGIAQQTEDLAELEAWQEKKLQFLTAGVDLSVYGED